MKINIDKVLNKFISSTSSPDEKSSYLKISNCSMKIKCCQITKFIKNS